MGGTTIATSPSLFAGLIAYYKLDNAASPSIDSHNGYDLVGYSSPAYNQATAKLGTSVLFPAADDFAALRSEDDPANLFFPGHSEWSCSFWIYLNTLSSTATHDQFIFRIISPIVGRTTSIDCHINTSDDKLNVMFSTMGPPVEYTYITTTNARSIEQWYHVCIVLKPTGSRIYVNNVDDTATPGTYSGLLNPGSTTSTFYIGSTVNTTSLSAYVDEFGVWDRALTTAEIALLYNSGTGLTYPFA
jgi:hypothetical protein